VKSVGLGSVVIEEGSELKRIETEPFSGSGFTHVFIPSSVESLGAKCFSDCQSLLSITFELG
jgi:hypothetical protein